MTLRAVTGHDASMRGSASRHWAWAPGLALAVACSGEPGPEPGGEVTQPIEGRYEVSGETVTGATGDSRYISGTIVIMRSEDGSGYTATFELDTICPGAEEALPCDVIGKGEGRIEGRVLSGEAETQLVMTTVPGVQPDFALVPRALSARVVSESWASVERDGSVSIEIANRGAPGESYASTRTTLRGTRVSAAGLGAVASGPQSP